MCVNPKGGLSDARLGGRVGTTRGWRARNSGSFHARERSLVLALSSPSNSSGVRTGKRGAVWQTTSVTAPSGRENDAPSPRTPGARSGMPGSPPPVENRRSTSTGSPCMCAARVSARAAGVAVNRPRANVPLACSARRPACRPYSAVIVSIICSGVVMRSTDPTSRRGMLSNPPHPVRLMGDHPNEEEAMKYMLLIHQGDTPTPRDPDAWARLSEAEQKQVFADYGAINQTPGVTPGVQMEGPETATTVRVQNGQTLVTDGPFVELKEAIGGYLFFEADNLDAAIELAARVPAARLGGAIEVRPIVER